MKKWKERPEADKGLLFEWPPPDEGEPQFETPPVREGTRESVVAPGSTPAAAIAVSELAELAKAILEGAFLPVWVRGEVTDFKQHRNGHWYFCLRDARAQIRCVVWSRDRRSIPAPPDDGMQVVALGQLGFHAARGSVQLTVQRIEAEGDGLWRKALEITRARLAAEGLLAPERKRRLPRFPRRLAVVTSPDGAAFRDIVAVARRRCPFVEIVLVPARVQGDGAVEEICAALDRVRRWNRADVVIVGRGGGGREDLWAFNDERVARAVAACPMPTISAVGHEVDITICDLVADLRAPTPSAAAEHAVPLVDDLRADVDIRAARLLDAVAESLGASRERARGAASGLRGATERLLDDSRSRMRHAAARLNDLSPLATLARGYAVARDARGRTLSSAAAFEPGDPFELLLRDGSVRARTEERDLEHRPVQPRAAS
jgi:exodeoxyribonuclease VII large subunit